MTFLKPSYIYIYIYIYIYTSKLLKIYEFLKPRFIYIYILTNYLKFMNLATVVFILSLP